MITNFYKNIKTNILKQKGSSLILMLVSSMFFMILLLAAIDLAQNQLKLNRQKTAQAQALQIAEAGVNYYRWLLYHEEEHYFDVAGCDFDILCPIGIFDYNDPFDPSNGLKGKYELEVQTPKRNGSSVITLRSTAWTENFPNIKKTIEVKIGKRSWSSYSILSNSSIKIDTGDTVYGNIHSNSGIRLDGTAYGLVTSAVKKYFDPLHCGAEEYGVHTHTYEANNGCDCPTDPNDCDSSERYNDTQFLAGNLPNYYPNVFRAGRSFPVQPVSFSILASNLTEMMTKAEDAPYGDVINPTSRGCTTACNIGFHITLNNDNYTVHNVQTTTCSGYGISSQNNPVTYSYPENGLIYVSGKDKLWINGNIQNNRITIMTFNGTIEGGNADIIVNGNITHSNNNGSEAIGLIAQRDIVVNPCVAGADLEIAAAMITKKGQINAADVSPVNTNLTINGSIASYGGFRFYQNYANCLLWVGSTCWWWGADIEKGYQNTVINYDTNLTYSPPPHFPTTGDYSFISWKEE